MAATRAIAVASNTTTSCLLFKNPFLSKHTPYNTSLRFKNLRASSAAKRLFTCRAIYNPEVQIKEEGQPETLDYRVFFVDNTGRKVLSLTWLESCLVPQKNGGVYWTVIWRIVWLTRNVGKGWLIIVLNKIALCILNSTVLMSVCFSMKIYIEKGGIYAFDFRVFEFVDLQAS